MALLVSSAKARKLARGATRAELLLGGLELDLLGFAGGVVVGVELLLDLLTGAGL